MWSSERALYLCRAAALSRPLVVPLGRVPRYATAAYGHPARGAQISHSRLPSCLSAIYGASASRCMKRRRSGAAAAEAVTRPDTAPHVYLTHPAVTRRGRASTPGSLTVWSLPFELVSARSPRGTGSRCEYRSSVKLWRCYASALRPCIRLSLTVMWMKPSAQTVGSDGVPALLMRAPCLGCASPLSDDPTTRTRYVDVVLSSHTYHIISHIACATSRPFGEGGTEPGELAQIDHRVVFMDPTHSNPEFCDPDIEWLARIDSRSSLVSNKSLHCTSN